MNKNILLVDYYGTCNEEGVLLGHSAKVLKDYTDLLQGEMNISVMASPCIIKEIDATKYSMCVKLPYDIRMTAKNSLFSRVIDKFKLYKNLKEVCNYGTQYDFIWFYRTDFFMFFYFAMGLIKLPKGVKKIALIYQLKFAQSRIGVLLEWFYRKGMHQFDLIINTVDTNGSVQLDVPTMYMPDYFYAEEQYSGYVSEHKKDKVVCLGTMNYYKKLEELVEVFNECNYPLEICGPFSDKDRFLKLRQKAKNHIVIQDRKLTDEEYYHKLGEARYSIMPYDELQYEGRTSGILLESMFVDTIPIAPRCLFETTQVSGISYEQMAELIELLPQCGEAWVEQCKRENEESRYEQYDRQRIQEELNEQLFCTW